MKYYYYFIILVILDRTSQASVSGSEKEKTLEDPFDFPKVNNAAYIYAQNAEDSFTKINSIHVDKAKIKCIFQNLPIFWYQTDAKGKDMKLSGWLDESGSLSSHTEVNEQCSPFRK